jgi:translation initiation factor IF-3
VPEVRVLLDDGTQLGILSRDEALKAAEERGLDLVEITARATPPVCRIMDYGRFKYQESKKQKVAKRHASAMELKEIKFRPKTELHDMEFKVKHVRRFLEEGNKCRLVIVFRGREIVHPNTGVKVLDKVVAATEDISMVEVRPALEGKRMIMILGPKAGVVRKAAELRKANALAMSPMSDADLARLDEAEDEGESDEAAAAAAAAAPVAAAAAPVAAAAPAPAVAPAAPQTAAAPPQETAPTK